MKARQKVGEDKIEQKRYKASLFSVSTKRDFNFKMLNKKTIIFNKKLSKEKKAKKMDITTDYWNREHFILNIYSIWILVFQIV